MEVTDEALPQPEVPVRAQSHERDPLLRMPDTISAPVVNVGPIRTPAAFTGPCLCAETLFVREGRYERHVPLAHSCAYVKGRNALIPEAQVRANQQERYRYSPGWTTAFSNAMDALAAEAMRMGTL